MAVPYDNTTACSASPSGDCWSFPWFGAAFLNFTNNLNWEALEVITDDGYILNMIHVTTSNSASKGPVLLVHGSQADGTRWFLGADEQ